MKNNKFNIILLFTIICVAIIVVMDTIFILKISTLNLPTNDKKVIIETIKIVSICLIITFLLITIIIATIISKKEKRQGKKLIESRENNKSTSEDVKIKAILKHMTDGIIAFNMKGKIILVNPAATRLLRIMPEDESFEQIFKKLDTDMNMEKIIYLEDWTSSEKRVTVGDKNIIIFFPQ